MRAAVRRPAAIRTGAVVLRLDYGNSRNVLLLDAKKVGVRGRPDPEPEEEG